MYRWILWQHEKMYWLLDVLSYCTYKCHIYYSFFMLKRFSIVVRECLFSPPDFFIGAFSPIIEAISFHNKFQSLSVAVFSFTCLKVINCFLSAIFIKCTFLLQIKIKCLYYYQFMSENLETTIWLYLEYLFQSTTENTIHIYIYHNAISILVSQYLMVKKMIRNVHIPLILLNEFFNFYFSQSKLFSKVSNFWVYR